MFSDPMNDDLQETEAQLSALKPAPLDAALMSRLLIATGERPAIPSAAELEFERHLATLTPAPLSAEMMARLSASVAAVPFPQERKILPFPAAPAAREAEAPRPRRSMLATAAAVALIGAATALLVPGPSRSPQSGTAANIAPSSGQETRALPANAAGEALPASFARGITSTSDEGVFWESKQRPHRILRVEFIDRVSATDANGKTVEIEQPRVGYILVPESVD